MNNNGISISELEVLISKKEEHLSKLMAEKNEPKQEVTYNAGDGRVGYYSVGARGGIDKEIATLREEIINLKNRLSNLKKMQLEKEINNNMEIENPQKEEIEWHNVEINEEWAIQSHYTQMARIEKEKIKLDKKINDVQTKPMESIKLQDKKSKLEENLNELKRYSESDIIMFAKQRKASYLNAKKRYSELKPLEKVKIKLSGKELIWEKIKDDHSITTTDLDLMYQGRSR